MRALFIAIRLVGAAAIVAAVVGQLHTSLTYWRSIGITDPTVQLVNFFSFFTIDSNLLAVAMLTVGAVVLIRQLAGRRPAGEPEPRWFTPARASITTYMTVTFVVYNVLLRGIDLPQGSTLEWSNEIVHVAGPLIVIVDWLFAPGRRRLGWRTIWTVVAFPIAWSIYTMVRGPLVDDAVSKKPYWYPYPFLNPNVAPEGYVTVSFYIVLIALVIGLCGAGAIRVSRRR